ncbi:MAG: threonylcarbamoyl-AMP synthase [Flavobacteriaceae bacterium]|nr:MAG: threonylcarbamoyl-AMP synthase [Flavobacteriaceae bacterium]
MNYNVIKEGLVSNGTILYPTDTVWGIGCDATSEEAVQKIFEIKQRAESKSLIILVDGVEMLKEYVSDIPEKVITLLKNTTKPTTIIYKNPRGLAKNVVADDNTVAVRIVKHAFCEKLIACLGKPIVSTSANVSGEETPVSFEKISSSILNSVDYIVNLPLENESTNSSTILRMLDTGEFEVLRK